MAFDKDVKRNFALREHTYSEIKQRWGWVHRRPST